MLRKIDTWSNNIKTNSERSIVFVSSSLGVAACNLADYKMYGEPDPLAPHATEYSQFKSLDQEIAATTKQKAKTINFSNSAAMISEDLLVAKEAVRLQGRPSLIILAIGPRDFLDHYTSAYHRSRLAQILLTRQANPFWQLEKPAGENLDKWMCKIWPFYSQRVEYRDLAIKIACETFNRSASLFSATKQQKAKSKEKEETPKAIAATETAETTFLTPLVLRDNILPESTLVKFDSDYRGRYLPIDNDRWNQELSTLGQFTQFCKSENINLLIIAMPITERNRNLLPSGFLAEHMVRVENIAKRAHWLNLMADPRFTPADFSDTVHLRSVGALKLAKIISAEVQKQQLLQQ